MEIPKVYFTTREVAERFGCSMQWVYRLAEMRNVRYKGNRKKRKFTEKDINKLKP